MEVEKYVMLDPIIIQTIIQGGAVGLMLVSIVLGYKIARLAINKGFDFVSNHLAHNTEAIKEGNKEVVLEIRRLSDKLDK